MIGGRVIDILMIDCGQEGAGNAPGLESRLGEERGNVKRSQLSHNFSFQLFFLDISQHTLRIGFNSVLSADMDWLFLVSNVVT